MHNKLLPPVGMEDERSCWRADRFVINHKIILAPGIDLFSHEKSRRFSAPRLAHLAEQESLQPSKTLRSCRTERNSRTPLAKLSNLFRIEIRNRLLDIQETGYCTHTNSRAIVGHLRHAIAAQPSTHSPSWS